MRCMKCGGPVEQGLTTSVTDLGDCIVIIRNVPCMKCAECDEVFYTADVVKKIEKIVGIARQQMQEVAIVDYARAA